MKWKSQSIREYIVLAAGAVVYAMLFALGSQIDETGSTALSTSLVRFVYALPTAAFVLYALFRWILPRLVCKMDAAQEQPFRTLGVWVLIFCSYVPMFLIQYPGSFSYDTQGQIFQIATGEYDAFHPLLHTLLLRLCISLIGLLGTLERCAAVYSLMQMAIVSGCFALFCASVSRSISKRAAQISVLFFVLYPSHMGFASNYTKDALFSVFFALFLALCFEEIRCNGILVHRRVLQILCGILACLLRNNMIYAMAAWIVCLCLWRKHFLRLVLYGLVIVALSRGVNMAMIHALDAEEGNIREMLSVPIQQLARVRVMAPEMMTQEELDALDVYITHDAYLGYLPELSDPVKNSLNVEAFTADPEGAFELWLSVGRKCPGIYLDAFLSLTLPSIYPYTEYDFVFRYIEMGIANGALTEPFGQPRIVQPGRFEAVREWLDEHVYADGADAHPVFRWLFNTGFIYWLLFMFLLYDMYRGDWQSVMLLMLPVLLYGTFLLGPVMQGRYLYPFVCCFPLFVLRAEKEENKPIA